MFLCSTSESSVFSVAMTDMPAGWCRGFCGEAGVRGLGFGVMQIFTGFSWTIGADGVGGWYNLRRDMLISGLQCL
jgi:hypothetical protein